MKTTHLAAARRAKLWSLNANLSLEKPHQLTKFAQQVHLNHIQQRTFSFKAPIAIFWDLQPQQPSSLTKPDLLRFRCFSGHVLSKTKSVIPHFFTFLTSLIHHLLMVKFSEKNQCQKISLSLACMQLPVFSGIGVLPNFEAREKIRTRQSKVQTRKLWISAIFWNKKRGLKFHFIGTLNKGNYLFK